MPSPKKSDLQQRCKDNGIEYEPKDTIPVLIQKLKDAGLYGRRARQPQIQEQEEKEQEEKEEETINGVYSVYIRFRLLVKDAGWTTREHTFIYNTKNERKTDIENNIIDDFIKQTYTSQSPIEDREVIKSVFTPMQNLDIRRIPNRETEENRLQYKIFPDDLKINKNPNQCVIDSIMHEIYANNQYSKYSRAKLIEDLKITALPEEEDFLTQGITLRHIKAWVEYKGRISLWVLDPFFNLLESYIPQNDHHRDATIALYLNNNHVFPITNSDTKKTISQAKKLSFKEINISVGEEDSRHMSMDEAMNYVIQDFQDSEPKIIHVETDDLRTLINYYTLKRGFIPTSFKANGILIASFEQPETKQIYIASLDYQQRKEVCEKMFNETQYIEFVFKNQSWAQIFDACVECRIGKIPTSAYSPDSLKIRQHYPISAYLAITKEGEKHKNYSIDKLQDCGVESFDIVKCYTSCLLENQYNFAIESAFDDVEPFKYSELKKEKLPTGKAYINCNFDLGEMKMTLGFYPSFFVDYCLKEQSIKPENITYIQRSHNVLAASTFKPLIQELIARFPKLSKHIINSGIGAFGKRYTKQSEVAITDSWEVAMGMFKEDNNVKLSQIGNSFWFLRRETKELLFHGNIGIREHIVALGNIKLNELQKQVKGPETKILAFNTDSVKVINPTGEFLQILVNKTEAKPGDVCIEDSLNIRGYSEIKERSTWESTQLLADLEMQYENIDSKISDDRNQYIENGFVAHGAPGCGKSYLLKQLYLESQKLNKKEMKLCWTKTAAKNIDGETLDHFFLSEVSKNEWIEKALKYDGFYVDEYAMIPEKWLQLFHEIKHRKSDFKFRMFGDPNQLHPNDYENHRWFDYSKSKLIHFLVDGNKKEMSYIEQTARYDKTMKQALDKFMETGTLKSFKEQSKTFEPEECNFSIVKSDSKRTEINDKWSQYYLERLDAKTEIQTLGKLKLWVGMFLISKSNKDAIINSTRYKLTGLLQNGAELETDDGEKITANFTAIKEAMRYGYADSVVRVISRTIRCKFNIFEVEKMDKNELFVALSRATAITDIGLEFCDQKVLEQDFKFAVPPSKGRILKPHLELKDGFLYNRTCGEKVYVGQTLDFERRKAEHEKMAVSQIVDEWEKECKAQGKIIKMEILEKYKITNEKQLESRENILISKISPEKCMNTRGKQKIAKEKVETKAENVEVEYTRFKINIVDETQDPTKADKKEKLQYLYISYRDEHGKAKFHKFSFKTCGIEEATKKAEEKRAELVKQYFK